MSQANILVFAASNSIQSINRRFAIHAATVLQEEIKAPVVIESLELRDADI